MRKNTWAKCLAVAGGLVSSVSPASTPNDFDGDQRSDLCVYNPDNGIWTFRFSEGGTWTGEVHSVQFGFPGTRPLTGDFDGDGTTDQAVYYPPQSRWFLAPSGGGATNFALGRYGAIPLVADFDGDGRADAACYEPATGRWNIRRSHDGAWSPQYGFPGTIPVAADYDGDGRADLAVMNTSDYTWYIQKSSGGSVKTNFSGGIQHTAYTDVPTPVFLDFDRDGRADLGMNYVAGYKYQVSGSLIATLCSSRGYTEGLLEDTLLGLGCFSDTNRMEGLWQNYDYDPLFSGVHLFAVTPVSPVTNKIRATLPQGGRPVMDGIPQAQRRPWPFLGMGYPLPSSPLSGRTATGLNIQLQISKTSIPWGLATLRDGRGGSAKAYMNVMGDYLLLDSPGTPTTGPITISANVNDISTQYVPTPWFIPGGFYDLPISIIINTMPGTYRDNRGETTISFSNWGATVPLP